MAVLLLGGVLPAQAHLLNLSKARVTLEPAGGVAVELKLDLLRTFGSRARYFELSQNPEPLADPALRALLEPLSAAIEVTVARQRVPLALTDLVYADLPEARYLDPFTWPRTTLKLRGRLALDSPPAARVGAEAGVSVRFTAGFVFEEPIVVTIEDAAADRRQTRWLVTGQRSPIFAAASWVGGAEQPSRPPQAVLRDGLEVLIAGVRHILPDGFDHLLFVAGLMLAAATLRALLISLLCFTVAHSLTLALASLGWVVVPSLWVESLILLSIVWVAVENLRGAERPTVRLLIVFAFGLLHGLGFAGALRELDAFLDAPIFVLLLFNLGVEVGQVLFVLGGLVLLIAAQRVGSGAKPAPTRPPLPLLGAVRRGGAWFVLVLVLGVLLQRALSS